MGTWAHLDLCIDRPDVAGGSLDVEQMSISGMSVRMVLRMLPFLFLLVGSRRLGPRLFLGGTGESSSLTRRK